MARSSWAAWSFQLCWRVLYSRQSEEHRKLLTEWHSRVAAVAKQWPCCVALSCGETSHECEAPPSALASYAGPMCRRSNRNKVYMCAQHLAHRRQGAPVGLEPKTSRWGDWSMLLRCGDKWQKLSCWARVTCRCCLGCVRLGKGYVYLKQARGPGRRMAALKRVVRSRDSFLSACT